MSIHIDERPDGSLAVEGFSQELGDAFHASGRIIEKLTVIHAQQAQIGTAKELRADTL